MTFLNIYNLAGRERSFRPSGYPSLCNKRKQRTGKNPIC